jgi:hypothetical protein
VETLSRSFASETFAEMLHLALTTVEVVASCIPKTAKDYNGVMHRALCWIVTHEDLELFISWQWFIAQFFPERGRLVDIIGGLDTSNWVYFEQIFNRIGEFEDVLM